MEFLSRLEAVSPRLSRMYEQGSEPQRRSAVRVACARAVAHVELAGDEIDAALQLLTSGASDPTLRRRLDALTRELDERYFDLDGDNSDALSEAASAHFFHKARVAAALAYGVSPHHDDWSEALYEAIHAFDDDADIVQIVETALTNGPVES